VLEFFVHPPDDKEEGECGPQSIQRVPEFERLVAVFWLKEHHNPPSHRQEIHEGVKDAVGHLTLGLLLR